MAAVAPMPPPTPQLVGPARKYIQQRDAYQKCPPAAPLSAVCDSGATAADAVEGDISSQVDACKPRARFDEYGLSECAIDTTVAGEHRIEFSVEDTATGLRVRRTRALVVLPRCSPAEPRCADGTCGRGGGCVGGEFVDPPNAAPTLTLRRAARSGAGGVVLVKRGVAYAACRPGQEDSEAAPCESGAVASDAEDGDLTGAVITCPPDGCLSYGCPRHSFVNKGIQGCGVDTVTAPVGTEVAVTFLVWDRGQPPQRAHATRLIRVVSPCDDGEVYCPEPPELPCGTVACAARALVAEQGPTESTPEVFFARRQVQRAARGGSARVVTPCGMPPTRPIAPCRGEAPAEGCGVDAVDPGGFVPVVELRERIVLSSRGLCDGSGLRTERVRCAVCPVPLLESGLCSASSYDMRYVLKSDSGLGAEPLVLQYDVVARVMEVRFALQYTVTFRGRSQQWQAEAWREAVEQVSAEAADFNEVLAVVRDELAAASTAASAECGTLLDSETLTSST